MSQIRIGVIGVSGRGGLARNWHDPDGRSRLVAGADIHLERESSIHADGPQGGDVRIESDAGTTWVSGSVTARGVEANGGEVRLLGERVALTGDARVDVSGETGGGVAKIGGDYKARAASRMRCVPMLAPMRPFRPTPAPRVTAVR